MKNYNSMLIEAIRHGAYCWFTPKDYAFILLAPRYTVDDERRLHSETKEAVEWPDGTTQYYFHGVEVPPEVILDPRSMDPRRILEERNATLRRIMMERYGWRDFLDMLHYTTIDDDPREGKLYRVELPGENAPLLLMDVPDKTRNPDNTFDQERYLIPAHPESRTVQEARALSWGVDPKAFHPIVET